MNFKKTGYDLGVIATIIVLLWIGILKFTPGEAMAIKGFVSNSFLMSWMYKVFSLQTVSNLIGVFEIVTGILLIVSFWNSKIGKIAGYLSMVIFLTTLSFLFTTGCLENQRRRAGYGIFCCERSGFSRNSPTGYWPQFG